MDRPPIDLVEPVLGALDADELAGLHERLLCWERTQDQPDWFVLRAVDDARRLSFQAETDHAPPVWPAGPGDKQMQLHLDLAVADLDTGVARAVSCRAVLAAHQPLDGERVLLDPAGHPFCTIESARMRPAGSAV